MRVKPASKQERVLMFDHIIENFTGIANVYIQGMIALYLLLAAVLFGYWLKPFVRRRRSAYVTALIYGVLTIVISYIDMNRTLNKLISLCIVALSILICWLLDVKRNPVQKIFLCSVFRLISWLTMEVLTEIGFFETELTLRSEWYTRSAETAVIEFFLWNLLQYGFALFLLYIAIRILHKVYKLKSAELTWNELVMLLIPIWTILLVKPIMASYFYLWMDGIENGSITENVHGNVYRMSFSILSVITVIITITMYQRLKEKQEEEFAQRAVDSQINDTYRHVEHVEEMYEKMRAMRHDIGNHLTVIEGLAQNGKTEELAGYIGELQVRFDELQPSVKTGNAVTDVVLSEVYEQCRKKGIAFESRFVYPEQLKINPFDMSVILTNALQNAIQAAEGVGDPGIMITSVVRERFFIISVKNTVSERILLNEEGIPDTTKKDPGHGYGLKNIRNIAQRYKGDLEIRQEETDGKKFFVLNVMMMG